MFDYSSPWGHGVRVPSWRKVHELGLIQDGEPIRVHTKPVDRPFTNTWPNINYNTTDYIEFKDGSTACNAIAQAFANGQL